jgi:beta-glucosidase
MKNKTGPVADLPRALPLSVPESGRDASVASGKAPENPLLHRFDLARSHWLAGAAAAVLACGAQANAAPKDSIDSRAARIVDSMTLSEQISLLRPLFGGTFANAPGADQLPAEIRKPAPAGSLGSAGFVPGIPRLNWPALQETDAGLGVANLGGVIRPNDEATALPATLALAASFDISLARSSGRVIGAEAHAKGFNVQLAGAIDLARDPRNGRNFEYAGEDPLLAGRIGGATIDGIQSQHVVSTIKHYALNDQESGRTVLDARIDQPAARESDLLAFQIGIEEGRPGSVMCSYNRVNGDFACENDFLLNKVLKHDWGYRGWVMSDWGAVHSLKKAVESGLDQESPQHDNHFGGLQAAVEKGEISRSKVRDMAFRIIRSMIAVGAVDYPGKPRGFIHREADAAVAQAEAEAGAVLLKNDGLLPLAGGIRRVLFVGGHADKWVAAGGGSSQVNPYGGLQRETPMKTAADIFGPAFVPSSPLKALQALRPDLEISFDDGSDPARAAAAARAADVAIVFATTFQLEGGDLPDLSLPNRQDALVEAVAEANPHTGVVLETANPVAMPWLGRVQAVLEAWYPGQRGGEAIAALLSGKASPSGRLPITFPASVDQLPRPKLDGYVEVKNPLIAEIQKPFSVDYDVEGSDVGYRWFERTGAKPLFPFGYGLTYTSFRYRGLNVAGGDRLTVRFSITNTGKRAGIEVAQLYVAPPGRTHRLAGWARVKLKPGQTRRITVTADPRLLASWRDGGWRQVSGSYDLWVSPSARFSGLHGHAEMAER